jgi:ribose 5-phosphate isomerase RpiB
MASRRSLSRRALHVMKYLAAKRIRVDNLGSDSAEIVRYPYYAAKVAEAVVRGDATRGASSSARRASG